MNQVFVFNSERCRLVRGAVGAALYDLDGGAVIPIPPVIARLLHQTEDYLDVADKDQSAELAALLAYLKTEGLCDLRQEPPPGKSVSPQAEPFRPDFAWCELTPSCNLRCSHCYGSFGPTQAATKTLTVRQWRTVLRQLRTAGFSRIQFIGGEPLLFPGLNELLFAAAGQKFSFIELFSNLLLLDDLTLNACLATGTRMATTLYATEAAVHDRITGLSGSFERTCAAIRRCRHWGIPVRTSCIVTRDNEGKTGPIQAFIEELGGTFGGMDQARPSGRGSQSTCVTTMPRTITGPPFTTGRRSYMQAISFNPCWHGKIAIAADGAIMPCVFARDTVAGNILTASLDELLNAGAAGLFWRLNKDYITTCRACEFRYACPDCRPLAAGWNEGRADAMTHGCAYDPYRGQMRTKRGSPSETANGCLVA